MLLANNSSSLFGWQAISEPNGGEAVYLHGAQPNRLLLSAKWNKLGLSGKLKKKFKNICVIQYQLCFCKDKKYNCDVCLQ